MDQVLTFWSNIPSAVQHRYPSKRSPVPLTLSRRETLSLFFMARIVCVMTFEVPQAAESTANMVHSDAPLSTGLGFTLTSHHHIRHYGHVGHDRHSGWRLVAHKVATHWRVAADFTRYPIRTRQIHSAPVTRVFNLVLDPPGNLIILAPHQQIYISASLGYHMRGVKEPEDRTSQMGELPVYTREIGRAHV